MKLTFLDKLGIGLLALGLSAILGPLTISFFKDRLQNNFQHITCYGENNKPIANAGIDWRGVRTVKDGVRAWFKLLVSIDELKKETVDMNEYPYTSIRMHYYENWGEAIEALNTMSTFYFNEKDPPYPRYIAKNFSHTPRPKDMNHIRNRTIETDAESSVFDGIKFRIGSLVSFATPLNDQKQTRPNSGTITFGKCRISEPRFFKNPNLIVPYDAPRIRSWII
tara:strand:- start:105 stop:773 length:669 start_codon:yes stop_codon:yes gene_type:complete